MCATLASDPKVDLGTRILEIDFSVSLWIDRPLSLCLSLSSFLVSNCDRVDASRFEVVGYDSLEYGSSCPLLKGLFGSNCVVGTVLASAASVCLLAG